MRLLLIFFVLVINCVFAEKVTFPDAISDIRVVGLIIEGTEGKVFENNPELVEKIKFAVKGGILSKKNGVMFANETNLSEPYILVKVALDKIESIEYFSIEISLRVATENFNIVYAESFATGSVEGHDLLGKKIAETTRALCGSIVNQWK